MSAVEEMLGLFQRYECFEQAPTIVRGHFCDGQNFGGSSLWRDLFLQFLGETLNHEMGPILGGSKKQKMWVNFEGFLENVQFVINPRRPVAPPEKILGPPKGAKGLFSGANCFFCFALGCVGNPKSFIMGDFRHPYLPSHDFHLDDSTHFGALFGVYPYKKVMAGFGNMYVCNPPRDFGEDELVFR